MSFADEVLQHLFSNFKVCDDAVLHRANGHDVPGRAAEHVFRIASDSLHLIRDLIDRHDRRFGNDDAAKLQYLSGVFGQQFATLDEARDFNLQAVSAGFDKNQDGLVCVYDLRGTRAYLKDPYSKFTYFQLSDAKVTKKADDALEFRSVPSH